MRIRCWLFVVCSLLLPSLSAAFEGAIVTRRDTGNVQGILHEHSGFSSDLPGGGRRLFVLLPPSYMAAPQRLYPVLYALDGRILFDVNGATRGDEWTLDEILARRPEGVAEMLVVSIESGQDAVLDHAPPGSTPQARGDRLLQFLTDEAQPFVAGAYRVRRERQSTLLLGTGDRALFALYAAWQRADLFAGAIALECPDVDARSMAWIREAPPAARPWVWFEQKSSDKARPSNADFLAGLKQQADVQVLVTGSDSNRTFRLLAALRACPLR